MASRPEPGFVLRATALARGEGPYFNPFSNYVSKVSGSFRSRKTPGFSHGQETEKTSTFSTYQRMRCTANSSTTFRDSMRLSIGLTVVGRNQAHNRFRMFQKTEYCWNFCCKGYQHQRWSLGWMEMCSAPLHNTKRRGSQEI